jgi:hypothetical protein
MAAERAESDQEGQGGRNPQRRGARGDRKKESPSRGAETQGRFGEGSETERRKTQRAAKILAKILA